MASKRRNMFHKNKMQETTEKDDQFDSKVDNLKLGVREKLVAMLKNNSGGASVDLQELFVNTKKGSCLQLPVSCCYNISIGSWVHQVVPGFRVSLHLAGDVRPLSKVSAKSGRCLECPFKRGGPFPRTKMDIKAIHKSSTFNTFTTSSTHKISAWFATLNMRTRKASIKASKSITLERQTGDNRKRLISFHKLAMDPGRGLAVQSDKLNDRTNLSSAVGGVSGLSRG
ncbi:hypothetical protein AAG570_012824 [Ranatra chinensis]|uniref:Uncharacterized protein n=1 Tax=Ranatra chinensis TaxID=642074 RepID=A0ABD0YF42_9HEMI